LSICVGDNFDWSVSLVTVLLKKTKCPLLSDMPLRLDSVSAVQNLIVKLNTLKVCEGNSEDTLLEMVKHRRETLHGSTRKNTL